MDLLIFFRSFFLWIRNFVREFFFFAFFSKIIIIDVVSLMYSLMLVIVTIVFVALPNMKFSIKIIHIYIWISIVLFFPHDCVNVVFVCSAPNSSRLKPIVFKKVKMNVEFFVCWFWIWMWDFVVRFYFVFITQQIIH